MERKDLQVIVDEWYYGNDYDKDTIINTFKFALKEYSAKKYTVINLLDNCFKDKELDKQGRYEVLCNAIQFIYDTKIIDRKNDGFVLAIEPNRKYITLAVQSKEKSDLLKQLFSTFTQEQSDIVQKILQ